MTRLSTVSKILAAFLAMALPALTADDELMRAMKDELARSMKKLQIENLQKPYFIAYRIVDETSCLVSASFGALLASNCEPGASRSRSGGRNMSTDVRVGDYTRDNTNFFARNFATGGVARPLPIVGGLPTPIDDNYDEIRRLLWLGTDSVYKNALDLYAKKKAALENRTRTDDVPDFSQEPVVNDVEDAPAQVWNRSEAESLVKSLSALFKESPSIDNSSVHLTLNDWLARFVNSEGTTYIRHTTAAHLWILADTQATDGMPLADFDVMYARSLRELPSREEMIERIRELQTRLDRLRKAALIERYSGPVLFEGQASAELLEQGLAASLVGVPRVLDDRGGRSAIMNSNAGLADRIGTRILPDFMTVTDNPALREFQGKPLIASYQVDDDGVKSGPTVVVDHGILKTLLHTRALIPGTTHSTASRRGPETSPSNVLFTTDKGLPPDQLRAELLRLVKQRGGDYGVIVRRMENPSFAGALLRSRVITGTSADRNAIQLEPLTEAYKVFPDGHEEMVRNLEINGMTLQSFKDIIAVSDTPYVYTGPIRIQVRSPGVLTARFVAGGLSASSVVAPSVLFEDMTLQRPSGDVPNLPFISHPFFDK